MKKILLIGSNIKNSLSPDIHNFIYKQLNLNAHYEIHEIEKPSQINNIIKQILNDNIYGINITAPYKSHIIDKVKLISKKAKKIGAINCIDSNLKGYNTDSYGFMKMLSKNNINLSKKNIHIIGSGGASQAILYALDIIGNKSITMYDRENVNQIITSNLNNDDVVVNCTPVHFINENNDFFEFFINRNFLWIDLLYTKLSTKKFKIIKEHHFKLYLDGIDMLIYQAMASVNIWFRKDIEKNVNFNSLKSAIKR